MSCNCHEKIKKLEDRIEYLERHPNICSHPRVEEDYIFDGEDEVRVDICLICGEQW